MGLSRNRIRWATALGALAALGAVACGGGGGGGGGLVEAAKTNTPPQASLSLLNSDLVLCHHNDTAWTLTKTPTDQTVHAASEVEGNPITWTVTATRGATTDNFLTVDGFVSIKNN